MANQIKPNNFPLRTTLDGTEELYTQTGGVNEKFTVDQVVARANALSITPLEFTFTNILTYTDTHSLGRQPINIRVVSEDGLGNEEDISVYIESTTTTFTITSNSLITGKVYVL